jgi:colanic acid/amylovoran biosynthesis glycosyltransferase
MADNHTICIVKPNKSAFSETFIQAHIDRLPGTKRVLYGGDFPLYDHQDQYLIRSKWGLINYLVQKRLLKKKHIAVRDRALKHWLQREQVDVVLAEYGFTGAMIAPACEKAGVPLVMHFHGADAHHFKTVAKYRPFYTASFRYAAKIIGVSGDMMNALRKLGAPEEKLVLLPYGVDTRQFTECPVAASAKNFLCAGRFVEKKSPLSVLRAFRQVLASHGDAHLWMAGDGPLLPRAQELAHELGISESVTFTGVLPHREVAGLMQRMRCYVQHSVTAADGDMEGTPNTILEASGSGLPVVSTRHAGIKEAIREEQTGFLVDEHDIDGMAEGMIRFAGDAQLAAQMGRAGRNYILEHYSIDGQIRKLHQLIAEAVKSRSE